MRTLAAALTVDKRTGQPFVANRRASTVLVLDGHTASVGGTVAMGVTPGALGEDERTGTVFVANAYDDSVSMVDHLAAVWGDDACVETPKSGAPSQAWQGRWLTVYQLQPDGSWLIVRDSGEEAK